MKSYFVVSLGGYPSSSRRALIAFGILGLVWVAPGALAKEPSLTAIELYDGTSGAAYIQLADVLINGKAELKSCAGAPGSLIGKSEYGKLPKVTMAPGGTLERGTDGVLRYRTGDGQGACVLPDEIKFEHGASLSPASMAAEGDLRGRSLGPGTDGTTTAQPLKSGVTLVFVAFPDVEHAEFLLAQRIGTVDAFHNYLTKYANGPHAGTARQRLASLYVDAGQQGLLAYQKTASGASPSYSDLKNAWAKLTLAHGILPNSEGESKLENGIHEAMLAVVKKGLAEMDDYHRALAARTPGYVHLRNAGALVAAMDTVDANFAPLDPLRIEVTKDVNSFESALRSANSATASKHFDEALHAIEPYRAFAGEEPRVTQVIDDAYSAYFVQAQELDALKDWKGAVAAYESALKVKETAEARDSLAAARKQYAIATDDATAKAALEKSQGFEAQKDIIAAYETLSALTPAQQAKVNEDMTRLEPLYVQAASLRAKQIAKDYQTIQGLGDEKAVQSAYSYLQRASELSNEDTARQAFEFRRQALADELSAWFLDRANHDLQKPLGSGTELGWSYLEEAERYKAANLEQVHDRMKVFATAHGMHSSLSVRVQFRDQTSQRQSEGFASQMESAIALGLESSGIPVKVIRSEDATHQDIEPDFRIAGDVLEHNIAMPPTVESVDSSYIAETREVPSEQYSKLDRAYQSATEELHTAQAALQGATTKGNKKAIADAKRDVELAQKKADDARALLDSTQKTQTKDVTRPYNFTKTTYNVVNRIVLQFRIDDTLSGKKGEPVSITKEEKKQFVVVSGVKPEDANKNKNEGTIPDKEELQNELEIVAREELTRKIQEQLLTLPHQIYEDAQKKQEDNYDDDAGEAYMRYLYVAPASQSTERQRAKEFLKQKFNFQVFPNESGEEKKVAPVPALAKETAPPAK